jgi:hypothetical protein
VRSAGHVGDLRVLGAHEHLCWAFSDPGEFRRHAWQFLAAGLDAGQRVWLVAAGETSAAQERNLAPAALWPALGSGAAQVLSADSFYPPGGLSDPAGQVEQYRAATRRALADGFTGLRVAADGTALVTGDRALADFASYEALADRFMAVEPFSGLCGFHAGSLSPAALRRLGCLHPASNVPETPFHLCAAPPTPVRIGLSGDLDVFSCELFGQALHDVFDDHDAVVLDAGRLRFADHRALLTLDGYARRRRLTARLTNAGPVLHRVAGLLDLGHVRAEPVR